MSDLQKEFQDLMERRLHSILMHNLDTLDFYKGNEFPESKDERSTRILRIIRRLLYRLNSSITDAQREKYITFCALSKDPDLASIFKTIQNIASTVYSSH